MYIYNSYIVFVHICFDVVSFSQLDLVMVDVGLVGMIAQLEDLLLSHQECTVS